jgi:hypothetical protein
MLIYLMLCLEGEERNVRAIDYKHLADYQELPVGGKNKACHQS